MLHFFNVFRENDGKENCAQLLEEEVNKMFGTKSLNDKHDCNVFSVLKIMMIALIMIKMFLISMSIFVE